MPFRHSGTVLPTGMPVSRRSGAPYVDFPGWAHPCMPVGRRKRSTRGVPSEVCAGGFHRVPIDGTLPDWNSDRGRMRLDQPRRDRGGTQGLAEPLRPHGVGRQSGHHDRLNESFFRINLEFENLFVRKFVRRSGCRAVTKRRRAGECVAVPKANAPDAVRRHGSAPVRQRSAAGRIVVRDSREPCRSRLGHRHHRLSRKTLFPLRGQRRQSIVMASNPKFASGA